MQPFRCGTPTRYPDNTAFLRRISDVETTKELDATSEGNNISVLMDWKTIPKAYFSSLECSAFLFLLRSISMEIEKYVVLSWNIKQNSI